MKHKVTWRWNVVKSLPSSLEDFKIKIFFDGNKEGNLKSFNI